MMIMIRCEEKHTETCTGSTGLSVAKYDTLSQVMMIMIRCEEKHTETCTGSTGLCSQV